MKRATICLITLLALTLPRLAHAQSSIRSLRSRTYRRMVDSATLSSRAGTADAARFDAHPGTGHGLGGSVMVARMDLRHEPATQITAGFSSSLGP